MSNQLRIRGKYASKLQKAEFEAKKLKSQAEMLMSIIQGQYKTIRRITEENKLLKHVI